ncbi:hypothetical protein BYT27DRAFT_7095916, partial [Phlegmacium glaucopus]
HNLAFKGITHNKLLPILANPPVGVPCSAAFKGYHIDHYKFMGQELLCLNNIIREEYFFPYVSYHLS